MIKHSIKWALIAIASILLLTSCLEGKNQVSLTNQTGTYIKKEVGFQTLPMIQMDNQHYIYDETFATSLKDLEQGQRLVVSYSVDFNDQPADLQKIGCYKTMSASVSILETYPTGVANSDETSFNDSITTIVGAWTNYQPDLSRYYLTTSGYVLGEKENKFKLYYTGYSHKTTNYDTIKFELRRDKYLNTTSINQALFSASFDITAYSNNFPIGSSEKFIIVSLKYPKKGFGLRETEHFPLYLPILKD